MEVHISITGDDESGKKVLDILTGGGILDNLETTVKPKKHAGRPKKQSAGLRRSGRRSGRTAGIVYAGCC